MVQTQWISASFTEGQTKLYARLVVKHTRVVCLNLGRHQHQGLWMAEMDAVSSSSCPRVLRYRTAQLR